MTIQTELQELSSRDPDGSIATGQHREVISGKGNTTTTYKLLPEQSGALCLFDEVDGVVYTLPTPVVGMWFEFFTSVTITTNETKVLTKDTSTEFILGGVLCLHATLSSSGTVYLANGTSHSAIEGNGTTKGGTIGDNYRLTAISTTQWLVEGVMVQTGNTATPLATS